MAMTAKERSIKAAIKRGELAEKELRHRVRPGIENMLADLMAWNKIEGQAEAVQLLIINAHAKGPEGSGEHLEVPRHKIRISENVARKLEQSNRKEALKPDEDEE